MWIWKIIAALALLLLIAGGAAAQFRKAHEQTLQNACLAQLQQINEPLNCCIPMESKLAAGEPIQPKQLSSFLAHGLLPRCPSGVAYVIPYVAGGRAVCPKHGDLLASAPGVKVYGPKPIYPASFPR